MKENMDSPYVEEKYRDTALRFIKDVPGRFGMPKFKFEADFYCEITGRENLFYETDNEFVVYVRHFILKDACLVTGHVSIEPGYEISKILFEGRYLDFTREEGEYRFDFEISGLAGPTRTLYAHTLLRENGLTLRIEQNDIGRCAGMYQKDTYPEKEIRAVHHYMFAMREIVRQMGLPDYLHENGLGYLLILGFETCNEIHTDYPPHWHLIFRWPYFCGSQAPHIYVDDQGRITENVMYIDGIKGVSHSYQAGEWCRFVDMYGSDVMAVRIEDDGGMSVTKPGGELFRLGPYEESAGVAVYRGGVFLGKIAVSEMSGSYCVDWNVRKYTDGISYVQEIKYDPLLGTVKNNTTRPVNGDTV